MSVRMKVFGGAALLISVLLAGSGMVLAHDATRQQSPESDGPFRERIPNP
jgi:hypothetical protein